MYVRWKKFRILVTRDVWNRKNGLIRAYRWTFHIQNLWGGGGVWGVEGKSEDWNQSLVLPLPEMRRNHERIPGMVDSRDRVAGEGCVVLEAEWEQGEEQALAVNTEVESVLQCSLDLFLMEETQGESPCSGPASAYLAEGTGFSPAAQWGCLRSTESSPRSWMHDGTNGVWYVAVWSLTHSVLPDSRLLFLCNFNHCPSFRA